MLWTLGPIPHEGLHKCSSELSRADWRNLMNISSTIHCRIVLSPYDYGMLNKKMQIPKSPQSLIPASPLSIYKIFMKKPSLLFLECKIICSFAVSIPVMVILIFGVCSAEKAAPGWGPDCCCCCFGLPSFWPVSFQTTQPFVNVLGTIVEDTSEGSRLHFLFFCFWTIPSAPLLTQW